MDFDDDQIDGGMNEEAEHPLDMGDGDSETEELGLTEEAEAEAAGMTIKGEDEFSEEDSF